MVNTATTIIIVKMVKAIFVVRMVRKLYHLHQYGEGWVFISSMMTVAVLAVTAGLRYLFCHPRGITRNCLPKV